MPWTPPGWWGGGATALPWTPSGGGLQLPEVQVEPDLMSPISFLSRFNWDSTVVRVVWYGFFIMLRRGGGVS